ncbi:MAG TPA: hypothetical protein VM535_01085, partial [Candidatus Saccharimonadales bacterium]|nr:hypothetical protein [Candidatus Saccharimonadales bacterium]
ADINSSADSPGLGGNFNPGGSRCLTDASPPAGATVRPGGYVQPGISGISNNQSVFVNGDVYINGNITYANNWAAANAPSFVLRATGNIYIAPGVTQLDGLYISRNTIYTCGVNNGGGNFAVPAAGSIYSTCKNQLVIFGNFIAKKVNLLRTFGSLRDEKPTAGTPGSPSKPSTPGAQAPLLFSFNGNPFGNGAGCVNLSSDGDDRAAWKDNYLCPSPADKSNVKLGWTNDKEISKLKGQGLNYCTASWGDTLEKIQPQYQYYKDWEDSYLCSNVPISFGPSSIPGQRCTLVVDPTLASKRWTVTWVCIATAVPGTPGTPGGPPRAPGAPACSNKGSQLFTSTCAGEVFRFSPALYLGTPSIQLPSGGATQYDSITSLPPVL